MEIITQAKKLPKSGSTWLSNMCADLDLNKKLKYQAILHYE